MRAQTRPNVTQLKRRREASDRRKIANQLSRAIRLERLVLDHGRLHELHGTERSCWYCGFHGRVFWVSTWHPATPGATIGYISSTPHMCAVCLWQRYARQGEKLHQQ